MLEWKSRLLTLLAFAAVLAVVFGQGCVGAHNFGW